MAVLLFADLSPEGDQEYFSDGIAEEILNVLVGVDGLDIELLQQAVTRTNRSRKHGRCWPPQPIYWANMGQRMIQTIFWTCARPYRCPH